MIVFTRYIKDSTHNMSMRRIFESMFLTDVKF